MSDPHSFEGINISKGVPFSTMGKEMLSHAKYLMDSNYVVIHRKFDKLLIGLRTAVVARW